MPELHIDSSMVGDDIAYLSLAGFLDAHTFEELDEAVGNLFESSIYKVIADMSGVEYISSAGAGVFIGSLTEAQESGGNIILVNPTDSVREVFDLLGLTQIFSIVSSKDEAVAQLQ